MIIWSGYGIVWVFLQLVASFLTTTAIFSGLRGMLGNKPAIMIALLLGAAVAYFAMQLMLKKFSDKGRTLMDPKTGQEVVLRRKDSLFFIPCRYWQVIVPALFVLSAVFSLFVK
jgi:hypothetical protein